MALYLYNSLTRKKEIFKPQNPSRVTMYTCGPTVYGPSHLGHARSYIAFDLLKKVLKLNGYKVLHVLNLTDIHDDMIKEANKRRITIFELANLYIPLFKKDLEELNVEPAAFFPRVTEVIPEIIEMIKILMEKGFAYVASDGSVYYKVSKFKNYGKLSGRSLKNAVSGTRTDTDKYEKEEIYDFALWKAAKEGEPFWDSPWGRGRPGWHIECSVMAKKFLGETLDIHAGAMDLKFPHHENEIAQSEAANGKKFVNYWVHAGLLDIEGEKMSRSLGNILGLRDLRSKGFSPLDFRYLTYTVHYRSKMNFTWEALDAAQNALKRLYNFVLTYKAKPSGSQHLKLYENKILEAVNNDIDMPKALSVIWNFIKDENILNEEKVYLLLKYDRILGLKLKDYTKKVEIPESVKNLLLRREKLRKQKKFNEADKIREEIKKFGFEVRDEGEKTEVIPM